MKIIKTRKQAEETIMLINFCILIGGPIFDIYQTLTDGTVVNYHIVKKYADEAKPHTMLAPIMASMFCRSFFFVEFYTLLVMMH